MRLSLVVLAFDFHLVFCFSFEKVSLYDTTSEPHEHCPLLPGLCPITNVQEETPFEESQRAGKSKDVQPETWKFLQQSGNTLQVQANALERRTRVKIPYRPGLGKEIQLGKQSVVDQGLGKEKQLGKQSVVDQGLRLYLDNQVNQLTKHHQEYDKAHQKLNAFASEYDNIGRSRASIKRYPNWRAALVTVKEQYNRQRRPVLEAQNQIKKTYKRLLAFQGNDPDVGKYATQLIGSAGVKAAIKDFHEAHNTTTPALKHVISLYHKRAGSLLRNLEKGRRDMKRAAISAEVYKQTWQAMKIDGVGKRAALARYEAEEEHANQLQEVYTAGYRELKAKYRAIRLTEARLGGLNQALRQHYRNENKKDNFGDDNFGQLTSFFGDRVMFKVRQ